MTSRLCKNAMPSAICAPSEITSATFGGLVLLLASERSSPRSIAVCAPPAFKQSRPASALPASALVISGLGPSRVYINKSRNE